MSTAFDFFTGGFWSFGLNHHTSRLGDYGPTDLGRVGRRSLVHLRVRQFFLCLGCGFSVPPALSLPNEHILLPIRRRQDTIERRSPASEVMLLGKYNGAALAG